ncbi:MAG: hypothetical protein AAF616_12100 [Bacteroidota bacterium]
MRVLLPLILFLSQISVSSQTILEWSPDYKISLEDFQSPQTEINSKLTSYSVFSGADMEFSFRMTTVEFMFTKNFNSKVIATFNKKAAVITAPDTTTAISLVNLGQYSFDLAELYSRKFRRKMHDQKGVFSNVSFFQPMHHHLQEEMNAEFALVLKATDLGLKKDLLLEARQKVLLEIEELSDFCKECKPPKHNRQKNP